MNARMLLRQAREASWRAGRLGRLCLLWLESASLDEPLPPSGRAGLLELRGAPRQAEKGSAVRFAVKLHNRGTHAWTSRGARPAFLVTRWLGRHGEDLGLGEVCTPLPRAVRPGESIRATVRLHAPDWVGNYRLASELVQRPNSPLQKWSPLQAHIPCRVEAASREDIDYPRWYSRQDLGRDHWTIVGPRAREEHERLGAVKLGLLKDLGLRPDSRVLDVGCGTGQVTAALADFLDERGAYHGTDLGREAVAFCRARFRRNNFTFSENEMTSIPLKGVSFDIVAFFSVLTHTYPEETARLLREGARLLAPGGVVFADVFTSSLVERHAGNRAGIEWNRSHFLEMVRACGLRAEVVLTYPWHPFSRREFFKFAVAGHCPRT